MSDIRKFFTQSSHYFVNHFLAMVASLITFPIYTRIFSVADYGLLSICATTIFFIMAIGKLGLQNSIIRFYEECKKNNFIAQYYSTLFYGSIFIIFIVCILYYIGIKLIFINKADLKTAGLLSFITILIFFKCANILIRNFLRAEQRTKLYNIICIIGTYCSLSLGILLVFYIIKGLYGLFAGQILCEVAIFIYLCIILNKEQNLRLGNFSADFLKRALLYGLPLVSSELVSIILNAGDRYVIMYFCGIKAVGLYSAGYNLADSAMQIIVYPLNFALMPLYMSVWVNKGEKAVQDFLSKTLKYITLLSLPLIFGLSAISKEIIYFLASAKFANSYIVVPYVAFGTAFMGLCSIFNAGLVIHKKTTQIAMITILSGVVNFGLNMMVVPKWGIEGAAFTTLISYILLLLLTGIFAFKYLRFSIDYKCLSKYFICSLAMYYVINLISNNIPLLSLFLKVTSGMFFYIFLVFMFDKEIRSKITDKLILLKHVKQVK